LEVRWSSRRKSAEKQLQLKKNLANSQVKVLASLYNKYTTQLSCSSAKKQKKKKKSEKINREQLRGQQNAGRYMQSTAQFAQFNEVNY